MITAGQTHETITLFVVGTGRLEGIIVLVVNVVVATEGTMLAGCDK